VISNLAILIGIPCHNLHMYVKDKGGSQFVENSPKQIHHFGRIWDWFEEIFGLGNV